MEAKKSQKRQRVKQLRVPALAAEITEIQTNAANCGMSVANYLRSLGMNYKPKSILDHKAVLELSKVNADLGRLGGLLKMYLSNDEKVKALGKLESQKLVYTLLDELKVTQKQLYETAKKI